MWVWRRETPKACPAACKSTYPSGFVSCPRCPFVPTCKAKPVVKASAQHIAAEISENQDNEEEERE